MGSLFEERLNKARESFKGAKAAAEEKRAEATRVAQDKAASVIQPVLNTETLVPAVVSAAAKENISVDEVIDFVGKDSKAAEVIARNVANEEKKKWSSTTLAFATDEVLRPFLRENQGNLNKTVRVSNPEYEDAKARGDHAALTRIPSLITVNSPVADPEQTRELMQQLGAKLSDPELAVLIADDPLLGHFWRVMAGTGQSMSPEEAGMLALRMRQLHAGQIDLAVIKDPSVDILREQPGLVQPIIDPIDLPIAVLGGFLPLGMFQAAERAALKAAAKQGVSAFSKKATSFLLRETALDVGATTAMLGVDSIEDLPGILSPLSAILGTQGAALFMTLNKKVAKGVLASAFRSNRNIREQAAESAKLWAYLEKNGLTEVFTEGPDVLSDIKHIPDFYGTRAMLAIRNSGMAAGEVQLLENLSLAVERGIIDADQAGRVVQGVVKDGGFPAADLDLFNPKKDIWGMSLSNAGGVGDGLKSWQAGARVMYIPKVDRRLGTKRVKENVQEITGRVIDGETDIEARDLDAIEGFIVGKVEKDGEILMRVEDAATKQIVEISPDNVINLGHKAEPARELSLWIRGITPDLNKEMAAQGFLAPTETFRIMKALDPGELLTDRQLPLSESSAFLFKAGKLDPADPTEIPFRILVGASLGDLELSRNPTEWFRKTMTSAKARRSGWLKDGDIDLAHPDVKKALAGEDPEVEQQLELHMQSMVQRIGHLPLPYVRQPSANELKMTFLHEAGHMLRAGTRARGRTLEDEMAAWKWAFDNAEKYGVDVHAIDKRLWEWTIAGNADVNMSAKDWEPLWEAAKVRQHQKLTDVPRVELNSQGVITDIAGTMENVAHVVGPPIIYKDRTSSQRDVQQIISSRLRLDSAELMHGQTARLVPEDTGPLGRAALSPSQVLKNNARALVTRPTLSQLEQRRFVKAANRTIKRIKGRLTPKQQDKLWGILLEGDDQEKVFQLDESGMLMVGKERIADDSVIDAYYAFRMLDDYGWNILNTATTRRLRNDGWQKANLQGQDVIIRPVKKEFGTEDMTGKKWTQEKEDAGWGVFEVRPDADTKDGAILFLDQGNQSLLKAISDSDPVVPRRKGHIARSYTQPFAITRVTREPETGELIVSRVDTAATRAEADRIIQRAEQELDVEAAYIAHRKDEQMIDIAGTDFSRNFLANLNPEEADILERALRTVGVDPETIDGLARAINSSTYRRHKFAKQRGGGLGLFRPAPTKMPDEAMSEYLSSVVRYATFAEWGAKLRKEYKEMFADFIDSDGNPLHPATIRERGLDAEVLGSVEYMNNQIAKIEGRQSPWEEKWEGRSLSTIDKIYEGKLYRKMFGSGALHPVDKAFTLMMENLNLPVLLRNVRGLTAEAKLGMLNVGQVVVQATAVTNLGAYAFQWGSPEFINGGGMDFFKAITYGKLRGDMPIDASKVGETAKLWNALEQSGFIAGVDFDDLKPISKGHFGSRAKLRKLRNIASWGFRTGESAQRGIIWFAERRKLIRELEEAGKLGNVEGVRLGDLDKQVFLDKVSERASRLALNMSNLDAPAFTEGFISLPLQFKQFLVKQSELFFSPGKLTPSERMGLWTTWGAVFGLGGIPLALDAINLWDYASTHPAVSSDLETQAKKGSGRRQLANFGGRMLAAAMGTEDVKSREWLTRLVNKGAINALDPDTDIGSRAGIGQMIDTYIFTDPTRLSGAAISTIADTLKIASDAIKAGRGLDDGSIAEIMGILEQGQGIHNIGPQAQQVARPVPGFKNIARAADALINERITDARGRVVNSEPTLKEIIYTAMGIAPGGQVELREDVAQEIASSQAVREWVNDRAGRLAKFMAEDNVEYAREMAAKWVQEINESPAARARGVLLSRWARMTLTNGLDPEVRTDILEMKNPLNPLED